MQVINSSLGPLPFFKEANAEVPEANGEASTTPVLVQPAAHRPAVLADGSYATQTALADTFAGSTTVIGGSTPNLRCACVS